MDVPVVAVAVYDHFGAERPFYVLAHDGLLIAGGKYVLGRAGFLPACRENAIAALRAGATTIVFPGGDYDVFRPTKDANRVDFGGQEQYLFLSRGEWLARLLRLESCCG